MSLTDYYSDLLQRQQISMAQNLQQEMSLEDIIEYQQQQQQSYTQYHAPVTSFQQQREQQQPTAAPALGMNYDTVDVMGPLDMTRTSTQAYDMEIDHLKQYLTIEETLQNIYTTKRKSRALSFISPETNAPISTDKPIRNSQRKDLIDPKTNSPARVSNDSNSINNYFTLYKNNQLSNLPFNLDLSEDEMNQEYTNAIHGSSSSSNSNFQAFHHQQPIQGISSSQDLSSISSLPPLFHASSDTSSSSLAYLSSQPSLSTANTTFLRESESSNFNEFLGKKDPLFSSHSAFSFPPINTTTNTLNFNNSSNGLLFNTKMASVDDKLNLNGSESSENDSCYDEVPRNSRLWNWIGESLSGMSSHSYSSEMKNGKGF